MKHWLGNSARGFCMGLADVIPGVSGGTVALILGIYPRLVDAVGNVGAAMLGRVRTPAFRTAVRRGLRDPAGLGGGPEEADARRILLLLFVAAGIAPAIAVGSQVLPSLLSTYPAQMSGLFLGLVAASVMIPLRKIERWRPANWALVAGAAVVTVWFTGLPTSANRLATGTVTLAFAPAPSDVRLTPGNLTLVAPASETRPGISYEPTRTVTVPAGSTTLELEVVARMAGAAGNLPPGSIRVAEGRLEVSAVSQRAPTGGGRDPGLLFIFAGGVLAISAMTLPGVSGAFVLLLLGLYHFVLYSLRLAVNHWDPDAISVVLTMGAAVTIGLLTFARVLKRLFARWRDGTLAVLVGLMLGSLRKLWPFTDYTAEGREVLTWPAMGDPATGMVALLFVLGGGVVLVLDWMGRRLRAKGALGGASQQSS